MEKRIFSSKERENSVKYTNKRLPFYFQTQDWDISGVRVEPKKLKYANPLLYVTGWSSSIDSHDRPIQSLAQRGFDVVAINPPRTHTATKSIEGLSLPPIELAKAEALTQTLILQNMRVTDIVAHSEGGIYGAIAALLALKQGIRVNKVILVSPGGLIGKDNPVSLTSRFFLNSRTEEQSTNHYDVPRNRRRRTQEGRRALMKPFLSLKEAHAIATTPLPEIITRLQEKGVKIAVIQGDKDPVFPIDKMEKEAQGNGVDLFYRDAGGGHNSVITRPETYAAMIEDTLTSLSALQ